MSWVKKSFVLAADLSLLISQFSLPASAANPENLVKPEFTESADGNPEEINDSNQNTEDRQELFDEKIGLFYAEKEDGVSVIGWNPEDILEPVLVIPDEIAGLKVRSIEDGAFKNESEIQMVRIGKNVSRIGKEAFSGCLHLEKIVFCCSDPEIGEEAFAGTELLKEIAASDEQVLEKLKEKFNGKELNWVIETDTDSSDQQQDTDNPEKTEIFENTLSDHTDNPGPYTGDINSDQTQSDSTEALVASGTCGESLTWQLDSEGLLTITGNGKMNDYTNSTSPWVSYRDQIKQVVLPEGLTRVGNYAFYKCTALTQELVLPDSLQAIGISAFSGCSSLTGSLRIPDSVTSVGTSAFAACSGMTGTLEFGKSVRSVGNSAFSGSGFSGKIEVPDQVSVNPGETVFSYMPNLEELVLGTGWRTIRYTFRNCPNLKKVTLRAPEFSIYTYSFTDLPKLETIIVPDESYYKLATLLYDETPKQTIIRPTTDPSDFLIADGVLQGYFGPDGPVTIPEEVTEIGKYAFIHRKITGISFPASITKIGSYAFSDCGQLSGELLLPDGLTTIENYAFKDCTQLTGSLVIPDGVSQIGLGAFYECSGFNGSLVLPQNMEVLNDIFTGVKNVQSLDIRGSVKQVNPYYLTKLYGLQKLTFRSGTPPELTGTSISLSGLRKLETIEVPYSSFGQYLEAFRGCSLPESTHFVSYDKPEDASPFIIDSSGKLTGYLGSESEVTIPDQVKIIGPNVFMNNQNITKIVFPAGLEEIDDYAFCRCKSLMEAELPASIRRVGSYSFYQCEKLNGIQFSDVLQEIGDYAFNECRSLSGDLIISQGVKKVGAYAFNNCSGLNGLLEIGAETISSNAFYNCSNLKSLRLLPGITTIGTDAFSNCSSISGDLLIPDGVTEIGYRAFLNCRGINGHLSLPSTLLKIEGSAFGGCTGIIGEIIIPDKITQIPNGTFSNLKLVQKITFPEGFNELGSSGYPALGGMDSLKEIVFKNIEVPTVAANEFRNLKALEVITVPFQSIGAYKSAFSNLLNENTRITAVDRESDFLIEGTKLVIYLGDETEVTVPDSVTEIGPGAFQNLKTVEKVHLPSTVTVIGDAAFSGCSALKEINLPENLIQIGSSAFYNCSSVVLDLHLPTGLTALGTKAFYGCQSITGEVIIPDGVSQICAGTFYGLNQITSIDFGPGITEMDGTGSSLFKGAASLSSLIFRSETPPAINNGNPFSELAALETVYVPNASIGLYQSSYGKYFSSNVRIKPLEGDSDFIIVDDVLISYQGEEENVTIPEGVVRIEDSAFMNNKFIQSVVLPSSLKEIGNLAFKEAPSLKSVQFSEQVETIGNQAFMNCVSLEQIILPDSVKTLGTESFSGCTALTSASFGAGLSLVPEKTFYNDGKLESFQSRAEILTEIGNSAFYKAGLTSMEFPEGLTRIGNSAFLECKSLNQELVLPTTLQKIDASAFYNCSGLYGDLILPDALQYVSASSFKSCTGFTGHLTLGSSMKTVGDGAFTGSGFSGKITVPDSISTIGAYAFSNMPNLEEFEFGIKCSTIRQTTYGCKKLKKITIHHTDISIYNYSFSECPLLTQIVIPNENFITQSNRIYSALDLYSLSQAIVVPEVRGDDYLIEDGTLIGYFGTDQEAIIPSGVTKIGKNAFRNRKIEKVIIPDSVTAIEKSAFSNCQTNVIKLSFRSFLLLFLVYVK